MAIITTTTIIDRFITVLETNLNTEIDSLDTDNNAVSGAAQSFTTPTITNAAINPFRDDERTAAVTIHVWEPKGAEFEGESLAAYAREGAGTNVPHWNRVHFLNASIRCDVQDQSDAGIHAAYRICGRVADGILVCAYKWPEMSVGSFEGLVAIMKLVTYGAAEEPQDTAHVERMLQFTAHRQDIRT